MKSVKRASLAGLTLFAAVLASGTAQAQYKYVSPTGEVTYSDQPPPPGARDVQLKNFRTGTDAQNANLPFDLRQAMSRFPVTLYTAPNCASCESGKALLRQRGVPYSEKIVSSDEDLGALKRLSPDGTIPLLTVGSQRVSGYNNVAWGSLLDDAGYPQTSELPPTYQNPAPEPAAGQAAPTAQNQ